VLASYSSPFILISAICINLALLDFGINTGFTRLLVLSLAFPLGFLVGRFIYFRRSHVEILYDNISFQVFKGHNRTISGRWESYRLVSITVDSYGRSDLRLYKAIDGDFVELPISRAGVRAQPFRDQVRKMLSQSSSTNLQVAEAA
jgi:hypothetical protein